MIRGTTGVVYFIKCEYAIHGYHEFAPARIYERHVYFRYVRAGTIPTYTLSSQKQDDHTLLKLGVRLRSPAGMSIPRVLCAARRNKPYELQDTMSEQFQNYLK